MESERRKLSRRNFSYYMRVMDESTGKLIGHLSDISTSGFKVDSTQLLPLNVDIRLRIDQIGEISDKVCLIFKARPVWCRQDLFDPNMYNVGFKIVEISSGDRDIFMKMFNTYGARDSSRNGDSNYASR